jgi:hypothetical protein
MNVGTCAPMGWNLNPNPGYLHCVALNACEWWDPSGISLGSSFFTDGNGNPESEFGQETAQATEDGAAARTVGNAEGEIISMAEAVDRAVNHAGPGGFIERTGNGLNFQFRSMGIDANGNVVARIGRLDVNPLDSHVSANGAHLNLEIHVNGNKISNIHIAIDGLTVRLGDVP